MELGAQRFTAQGLCRTDRSVKVKVTPGPRKAESSRWDEDRRVCGTGQDRTEEVQV